MNENVFLLHAVLLGVEITFLYDILRILRRVFVHGNLRRFAVLGALTGMYLYHRTFSPLLVKYVSGLLNSILSPIRRKTQAVKSWLKKQLTSLWKMLNIFYKGRCAYGKEKNSLPQETAPEPVQHVLSEPSRIDDHGRRGSAECGITTED